MAGNFLNPDQLNRHLDYVGELLNFAPLPHSASADFASLMGCLVARIGTCDMVNEVLEAYRKRTALLGNEPADDSSVDPDLVVEP